MKRIRRILALLIITIMVFALCACSSSEQTTLTTFVSGVADKYNIDLQCVQVPSNGRGDQLIFSSKAFNSLSDSQKVSVFNDLDALTVRTSSKVDVESDEGKELAALLDVLGHGTMNVKSSNVIIDSSDKEYLVASLYDISHGTLQVSNIYDCGEDGYYLIVHYPSSDTYESVLYYSDSSQFTHRSSGSSSSSSGSGSSSSGSGSSHYGKKKCAVCNGTGYVRYYYGDSDLQAYLDGEEPYTTGECTSCNGTGWVDE